MIIKRIRKNLMSKKKEIKITYDFVVDEKTMNATTIKKKRKQCAINFILQHHE